MHWLTGLIGFLAGSAFGYSLCSLIAIGRIADIRAHTAILIERMQSDDKERERWRVR